MGDTAMLAQVGGMADEANLRRTLSVARALAAEILPGVTDIVPAFTTVTVHYDPRQIPPGPGAPVARVAEWLRMTAAAARPDQLPPGREVEVPVCYGGEHGPDLATVALRAKLTETEVVKLHSGARYTVAAVGFSPGFPYLLGLPARLAMPRRATPRLRVPAGSVAIGGAQAGVYPFATPGGWQIVGRTSLRFFRPEARLPALLFPGDTVRFKPVTPAQWSQGQTRDSAPPFVEKKSAAADAGTIEVVRPGGLTTVQDLGRPGWQRVGVTPGGAMDRQAARVANILLGNADNAPVLESALTGPELRFHAETWIAVTGAEARGVAGWRPLRMAAGARLSLADLARGSHLYVAVAGGFAVSRVLGGSGTLLSAGLGGHGGRALRVGDRLSTGSTLLAGPFDRLKAGWGAAREFWTATGRPLDTVPTPGVVRPGPSEIVVRFVRGRRWGAFDETARTAFKSAAWRVGQQSDRMGLRLLGPALTAELPGELVSEGVAFGTVQVPPSGQPIVLMADRQTLGGYPKIAHVIAVDLPHLAQARPGDIVRFVEIPVAEAQAAAAEMENSLGLLRLAVASQLRS